MCLGKTDCQWAGEEGWNDSLGSKDEIIQVPEGAGWALNAVEALEGCKQDLSYILKGDSGCCVEMNCRGIGECWKTN